MNADGTGARALTTSALGDSYPAFAPDNSRILFARDTDDSGNADEIFAVKPDGSGEVNLTNNGSGDRDSSPDWQPIPVKCGGKRSTLVGTAGKDKLVGTAGRDVISGLGGRDRIKGKGGNDVLCGNGGNDRLIAGKGKKDRCLGAKGKDTGTGCEAEKGI